jgi:dTMP kinase
LSTVKGGRFISFEGPDGGGKSTQFRLLVDRLRAEGREVVENFEPGRSGVGQQIRQILLDPAHNVSPRAELLLYFASRAQAVDERIRPAIARGAIVVSDRFTDSTLAYQGAGRGLDTNAIRQLHAIACQDLQPHLTLCLDIEPDRGRARARDRAVLDRLESEAGDFHQRVRDAYLALAAAEPERIRVIDADRPIQAVAAEVWEKVSAIL